jgi:Probable Zinc-ribbon domain
METSTQKTASLIRTHPHLFEEWHPVLNGGLPDDVTYNSKHKIWWIGKCGHPAWQATINDRKNRGSGCPFCDGKRVCKATCLAVKYPNLVKEWHPKNTKSAYEVMPHSDLKVWWKCATCQHEWKTHCKNRTTRGAGCPGCFKSKNRGITAGAWKGFGGLSNQHWGVIRRGAKQRNLEFCITIEFAWNLFLQQNRRCALSDCPLYMHITQTGKSATWTASLDRIDNSKGYVSGNVQWIHKDYQEMKMDSSQDKFDQLCCDRAKKLGWIKI